VHQRVDRVDEVAEHVALVLPERRGCGQDALDEAIAPLALGAEAGLAPEDRHAKRMLGGVVRRFGVRHARRDG
jgi:hypothetical protein